jgi:hypothetical protein
VLIFVNFCEFFEIFANYHKFLLFFPRFFGGAAFLIDSSLSKSPKLTLATLTTPYPASILQRQHEENPHSSPKNQHFSRENSFNIAKAL